MIAQTLDHIDVFPRRDDVGPTEVAVGRRWAVDRAQQLEAVDNRARAQVEALSDGALKALIS